MEPLDIGEAPHSPSNRFFRSAKLRKLRWDSRSYRAVQGVQRSKVKDWNIWESVLQIQLRALWESDHIEIEKAHEDILSNKFWRKNHLKGEYITLTHRNVPLSQFKYPNNILTCQFNHTKSNLFEVEVSVLSSFTRCTLTWTTLVNPILMDGEFRYSMVQYV